MFQSLPDGDLWPTFGASGMPTVTRWPVSALRESRGCNTNEVLENWWRGASDEASTNLVSNVTWCKDGETLEGLDDFESLGAENNAKALPTPQEAPILAWPRPMAADPMENWRSASPIFESKSTTRHVGTGTRLDTSDKDNVSKVSQAPSPPDCFCCRISNYCSSRKSKVKWGHEKVLFYYPSFKQDKFDAKRLEEREEQKKNPPPWLSVSLTAVVGCDRQDPQGLVHHLETDHLEYQLGVDRRLLVPVQLELVRWKTEQTTSTVGKRVMKK